MTPTELDLIEMDSEVLLADPSGFAANFYQGLFEIAPETRQAVL